MMRWMTGRNAGEAKTKSSKRMKWNYAMADALLVIYGEEKHSLYFDSSAKEILEENDGKTTRKTE